MKQTSSPIHKTDQRGMAAILITMVTMVVISLIVLSFAVISRREQTSTLNQQLSTQAFYAAESGVNDVVQLAKQQIADGHTLPAKTSCNDNVYPYSSLNNIINSANNVSYSCLLVDPAPTLLSYGDIGADSTVIPLKSVGGNISTLTLKWTAKNAGGTPLAGCSGASNVPLTSTTNWNCGYGVLRFDLVPTSGNMTAAILQNKDMVRFMIPARSGGSANINYAPNPSSKSDYKASCNNSNCSLTIHGLSGNQYYMRVMSLYQDSGLKISAKDNGGQPLGLESAQIAIDSTGKAQDVLRRIRVNVSIAKTGQNYFPDNGLQSAGSICKRFDTSSDFFENMVPSGISGNDALCGGSGRVGGGPVSPIGPIGGDPGANYGGCPGAAGCPPGSGKGTEPAIGYGSRFVNTTSDPAATASNVSSCTWNFGDGSPVEHSACYTGQNITHTFKPGDTTVPKSCYDYTVTLTIYYKSGQQKTKSSNIRMPGGTESPCR